MARGLLWACCCCGGLPILGLIKGALVAPFTTLLLGVCNTVSCLLMLPHDIVLTYWTLMRTPRLGCNMKILGMLLLPACLAVWPVMVIVASFLGGLGIGLFTPMLATFEDRGNVLVSGMGKAFDWSWHAVVDFAYWNYRSVFQYLQEMRAPYYGRPFDVPILSIFVGLFVAVCGIALCTPLIALLGVIKIIPMIVRAEYELLRSLSKRDFAEFCLLALPTLIGAALIPVGVVGGYVISVCGAVFYGISAAATAHSEGFGSAFQYMWDGVYKFDRWTNEFAFDSHDSCLPSVESCCGCCGVLNCERREVYPPPALAPRANRQQQQQQQRQGPGQAGQDYVIDVVPPPPRLQPPPPPLRRQGSFLGTIKVGNIWTSFFTMCEVHGRSALDERWISTDDIESFESYLFAGLTGLVVLRALFRSIELGSAGIVLGDGTEVNDENRPHNPIGNAVYLPCIAVKQDIVRLNLSAAERIYLEKLVLLGNRPDTDVETPEGCDIDPARTAALRGVRSGMIGLATSVTMMPQFHRLFGNVLRRLADYVPGDKKAPMPAVAEYKIDNASPDGS